MFHSLPEAQLRQFIGKGPLQSGDHLLQSGIGLAGELNPLAEKIDMGLVGPVIGYVYLTARRPVVGQTQADVCSDMRICLCSFLLQHAANILCAECRVKRHSDDDILP